MLMFIVLIIMTIIASIESYGMEIIKSNREQHAIFLGHQILNEKQGSPARFEYKQEKIAENQWQRLSYHDGKQAYVPTIQPTIKRWDQGKNSDIRKIAVNITKEKTVYKHLEKMVKNAPEQKKFSLCTTTKDSHNNEDFFLVEYQNVGHRNSAKKVVRHFSFKNTIKHHVFSHDGRSLAIGLDDDIVDDSKKTLHIINTKTNEIIEYPLQGRISVLASAHHSTTFVAGNDHHSARNSLLIIPYYKEQLPLDTYLTHAQFNPDDTRLLTCLLNNRGEKKSTFTLWDTSNLNNIQPIAWTTYKSNIQKALFVLNGKRIVIAHQNGKLHLLHGITGDAIKTPTMLWQNDKNILQFSPHILWSNKHKLLITTSPFERRMDLWNIETGQHVSWFYFFGRDVITEIGLTEDEESIVVLDAHEQISRIRLYNDQEQKEIAKGSHQKETTKELI